ncbi:unnamed protein product [Arctogadus glacialis]
MVMEEVLKNLQSTAELLAAVQTDLVRQWDTQTLDRAFQWTLYCQLLYARFNNKKTIRSIMEKHLQTTNESLRATFPGHMDVSFGDLSRCQHLLLTRLLKNPVLPRTHLKVLVGSLSPMEANENEPEDSMGHVEQLIACRSASRVLTAMPVRTNASPGVDAEVQGRLAEVQGRLLMETLDAGFGGGGEAHAAHELLEEMLQRCEEEDHVVLVIASALRRNINTPAATASRGFLLNWLQQNEPLLQNMCLHVPLDHIMSHVKDNLEFRARYCVVLKRWASDMTFDIDEGEWVPTGTTAGVSFQQLTEHFAALVETSPLLREEVEKELNALKMADGDFDVEGLSVWGDLLAVLSK